MTHYVIVGMGVAGISAAEAIRSVDSNGALTIISDDPHGYYSRPGLAYYLTNEVDESTLFSFKREDLQKLNANFLRGTVIRIHHLEHQLELSTGQRIYYDRLLLAVGSSAIRLKVPGNNLEGVVKLDRMEDVRRILGLVKRVKSAVVVGGGITALELAEGLTSRKVKVDLLIRTAHYWSNVLDDVEAEIVEHKLKEDGITIRYKAQLAEILGKGGQVVGVRLLDGEQIACDLLAYGIGVKPRLTLARQAGIACERGILVDEHLRTNILDIYAAGDIAQVFDPDSGRAVLETLWAPARAQGFMAGMNMAGHKNAYLKPIPVNVTRLAGLTTTIIGFVGTGNTGESLAIAHGDSETWHDVPDAIIAQSGFDFNHLRLMVGKKTIVGAIVMGDQKLSSALQSLIRTRVNITSIRAQLVAPDAPIADIIAHFWRLVHANQI